MIFILLLSILLGINIYQLRTAVPGSDHFFHFAFINSTRANKHRFFTKIISFVNSGDYGYPQLLHWVLSFFSDKFLRKYYNYIGLIFNVLSFLSFYIFIYYLYPYLNTNYSYNTFVLLSGLIYILTPFEYFSWNAKNIGVSARGFGVFLGQLFVYLLLAYLLSDNIYLLIIVYFLSFIILISSQFAFQFVLFFSIINSIIFSSILLFFIPFFSAIILLIIMPSWGVFYFKRQWGHKKMYYKYLSQVIILNNRYSIWRDFIYDFFTVLKKKGFKSGIYYFYQNPVIQVLIGFPFILVITYGFIYRRESILDNSITLLIISSLIIFVLTSFKKTRFLGEPQRYVEFIYPLIILLPFVLNISIHIVIVILCISLTPIIFELIVLIKLQKHNKDGYTYTEKVLHLKQLLKKEQLLNKNDKIISNNFQILKFFADTTYKIMNVNITNPYTGKIHFTKIFPEKYGTFNIVNLIYFIDYYKFNIVIIDKTKMDTKEFITKLSKYKVEKLTSLFEFTVYRIC